MKSTKSNAARSEARPLFKAESLEHWRKWLAVHRDTDSEVWLVFYKRGSGQPTIAYEDAVDEALCVGWIDSLVKRLDDVSYARKFTPRKAESKWSALNRARYARLKAQGRLTDAGVARAPTRKHSIAPAQRTTAVPAYIQRALKSHPSARAFFAALPPSQRRLYVGWIDSAKRPETRSRRLAEAIRLLAAGKKLGLK